MGIIEPVDVQTARGIQKQKAMIFAAYQRLRNRKRESLLPANSLCRTVPQAGHRIRTSEEGFVTQAHGVKAHGAGQCRKGFRVPEEALSAPLWYVEAEDPIGSTGTPEHQ